jgi:ATP-dependent DNA helicase DinG
MGLQDAVERAFSVDGVLADCVEEFRPRGGQIAMANAVAQTIDAGGVLVVEAGTGVGKTFAYLVPALLSGERVLLSTATKNLQDQLFGRDIPRLVTALGLPVRIALLKGRSSYLCMHRLADARQSDIAHKVAVQRDLARVEAWSQSTRAGDIAELTALDEGSPVIPLVTSTRDNCLGARCPQINNCHVNLARREALAADVVVINHHLFFADLNIRESGVAELLPNVRTVVFDEAHQLNEIGVQFLGRQLSTQQLDYLGRDLGLQGYKMVQAHSDWPNMLAEISRSVQVLRALCSGGQAMGRIAWQSEQPSGIATQDWLCAVSDVHTALQHVDVVLRSLEDLSPELRALHDRASRLMAELDVFSHAVPPDAVRWLEVGHSQVRLDFYIGYFGS